MPLPLSEFCSLTEITSDWLYFTKKWHFSQHFLVKVGFSTVVLVNSVHSSLAENLWLYPFSPINFEVKARVRARAKIEAKGDPILLRTYFYWEIIEYCWGRDEGGGGEHYPRANVIHWDNVTCLFLQLQSRWSM